MLIAKLDPNRIITHVFDFGYIPPSTDSDVFELCPAWCWIGDNIDKTEPSISIEERIEAIDAQYEQDKNQLFNYYTEAVMRDDAELQEEIKSELTALDAQYDLDINAIE